MFFFLSKPRHSELVSTILSFFAFAVRRNLLPVMCIDLEAISTSILGSAASLFVQVTCSAVQRDLVWKGFSFSCFMLGK